MSFHTGGRFMRGVIALVIVAWTTGAAPCGAAGVMQQAAYLREPPPVADGVSHRPAKIDPQSRPAPSWRYFPRAAQPARPASQPLPDNEAGYPHQLDPLFDQEPRPEYDRPFYEKQDWDRPMYVRPDYAKPVDQLDTVTKPAWNRPLAVKPDNSKPANDLPFELRPGTRTPTSARADYSRPDDFRDAILAPGDERPGYDAPVRERPMYDAPLWQAPEYLPERYLPPAAIKPQE